MQEAVPDFLQPYKGRLTPRFYEVRSKMISFINEVIQPNNAKYASQFRELRKKTVAQGLHPLKTPQPPVLQELREEAKKRGLWNFFLPEVRQRPGGPTDGARRGRRGSAVGCRKCTQIP